MNYIILYGAIQSFFMALIIINKRKKVLADYVLGIWLILIGFHILSFFIYQNDIHSQKKHLLDINLAFPLLNGVFLYVYVTCIIHDAKRFDYKKLLHFIPFILLSFFLTHNVLFGIEEYTIRYYGSIVVIKNSFWLYTVFNIFILLSLPVYIIWCLIILHRYRKQLKRNYSSVEKINLNWLRYVIYGLGIVWLTVYFLHFYVNMMPLSSEITNQIVFSAYTVFVFFIGYFGFRQSLVFSNLSSGFIEPESNKRLMISDELVKREKYSQSGLRPEEAKQLNKQLLEFMVEEKPYTDNNLTLHKLSELVGISSYHMSQILNEYQNQNFYDFINSYRVEEFKYQIADKTNKDFTILSVAYDCGFNSKATFNRIFKNVTGKTPTEYRSEINE